MLADFRHRTPRIAGGLLPRPPYLPNVLHEWESRELFTITKHGVKFTGMPAWPTLVRDDEVWAMVAFLRQFPALNEAEYRRLAAIPTHPGDAAEPRVLEQSASAASASEPLLATCARCHGRAVPRARRLGTRARRVSDPRRAVG